MPRVRLLRHVARFVIDYFNYPARLGASARRAACHAARRRLLRLAQARHLLLRLRRASKCLGTSRGSSRGSLSTTSLTPRVRVPRHVARLVTRLVVDYFTYAACPVASARRASCRVTHRRLLFLAQSRRRLLRLCCAFGCLDTSRGSSPGSASTTSPTPRVRVPQHIARLVTRLVVDYFTYAVRPVALARRVACRVTRRRLLHLHRASGCLGISHGSSRGSSSTTSPRTGSSSTNSPTPCVQVPRHVAWLVTRLVVDYFTYAARPSASAHRATRHSARH
jgi:hypothetical protein